MKILITILLISNVFSGEIIMIDKAPTRVSNTLIRGEVGAYMARRDGGKFHTGVDIVANQSSMDKSLYEVYAVANGKIAYSRLNGGEESGYGYTIVIDHGDSTYTQYSHLAINISKNIVKMGDEVRAGQLIAYLADLTNNERSSGNVRTDVVKQYDKIQLHFEYFKTAPGRISNGALSTIKSNCKYLDPTPSLLSLGYSSF